MLYTGNQWSTARDNYVTFKQQHELRAERVRQMIVSRALRHWRNAYGPKADRAHMYMAIHNAMCDINSGQFTGWARGLSRWQVWQVKQAYAILNREWEPSRILSRWADRMFPHYTRPKMVEYWLNKS